MPDHYGPPADWTEWQKRLGILHEQLPTVSEIALDADTDDRDAAIVCEVRTQSAWERIQTDPGNRTVEIEIGRFDLSLLDSSASESATPLPSATPQQEDDEWF